MRKYWQTMSLRTMGRHLGISPSRILQIASTPDPEITPGSGLCEYLGPKPRPPPRTSLWQCKGCGKQEKRAGKRRARQAFCTNCRSRAGSIGLHAYRMRYKTQKPWAEIAAAVRSQNTASCRRQAQRYAIHAGLPWPVPKLTMQAVLRVVQKRAAMQEAPQQR